MPEALKAFDQLKIAIASLCLGNHDDSKPFHLYVHESNGFMSGILTQSQEKK